MSQDEDRIYQERMERIEAFQFDARVAQVFDNMIRRSVPGYATLLELMEVLTMRYVSDGTRCYDLGCSLGTALGAMRRAAQGRSVVLHGVDTSPAMLERCQQQLDQQTTGSKQLLPPFELTCGDVRDIDFLPCSVVVMNFTLQFVPPTDRNVLLRRIYEALVPGGALILSEKLSFESARGAWLQDLHDRFRKHNGYTELELSQKRAALEEVLFPEPADVHLARLSEAGFEQHTIWFQSFNFASFLAVKGASA